jgi:hypothetical protein
LNLTVNIFPVPLVGNRPVNNRSGGGGCRHRLVWQVLRLVAGFEE